MVTVTNRKERSIMVASGQIFSINEMMQSEATPTNGRGPPTKQSQTYRQTDDFISRRVKLL